VINAIATASRALPSHENSGATGSASDTAAVADARNPASVMPTWMVARKRLGSRASRTRVLPAAPPCRSSRLSWPSRREISAISDPAKIALSTTRTPTNTMFDQ
jgi:hypothetical protein